MIYVDNDIIYHIFKFTKKFCTKVELLYKIWLAKSLDFNLIKNF